MSEDINIEEIKRIDPLSNEERSRSNFVRQLILRNDKPDLSSVSNLAPAPRRIVQFWDDLGPIATGRWGVHGVMEET